MTAPMSTALWLKLTPAGAWVDYSEYLLGSGQVPLKLTEELNTVPKLEFGMGPDFLPDVGWTAPGRGAEVRLVSDTYGPLFRGFIVREPQPLPLGEHNHTPLYNWQLTALGEQ